MFSGRFWAFAFDMSGFQNGGGILTVRHSKAVVCHFRVTKKRRICFLLIRMNYKKQKQSGGKDEQFRLFVFFVLRKAL